MNNFREVNDDILKEWLSFREESISGRLTKEDKKHYIYFDEIATNILRNVPKHNQKYVKKQLDKLDKNFIDYLCYWNEKYYRNGFVDGSQLAMGCFDEQLIYNCATFLLFYSTDEKNCATFLEICGTIKILKFF